MRKNQKVFLETAQNLFENDHYFTRNDLKAVADEAGIKFPSWVTTNKDYRVSHGKYKLPFEMISSSAKKTENMESEYTEHSHTKTDCYEVHGEDKVIIPEKERNFYSFSYYNDLKKILSSGKFFPVYLQGLSGGGKTTFTRQACAELKRKYVRVSVTEGTNEGHLMGSFRLVNGETVFYKGPVVQAMEEGAVLLLDEGDQASPSVNMCLQAVLEGQPHYIKETGEMIFPSPGFNVILAANTKGQGDETGMFMGAQIQNEANLDRFAVTFEHPYPPPATEKKILKKELELNGYDPREPFFKNFVDVMVDWAKNIRKSFDEEAVAHTMSLRRLKHLVNTYAIFENKHKSIKFILSRFEEDTQSSWLDLFKACDEYYDAKNHNDFDKILAEVVERKKQEEIDKEQALNEMKQQEDENFFLSKEQMNDLKVKPLSSITSSSA